MSLDIKKLCYLSLTTIVQPGYCHLKSEVAALNWCWCWWCSVLVWCSTLHSTYLPITKSVVLRHLGCQLCSRHIH